MLILGLEENNCFIKYLKHIKTVKIGVINKVCFIASSDTYDRTINMV